jgi:diguanylate cyclase (GGDEF)-like protein
MFVHHPYPTALLAVDGTIRATNFAMDRLLGLADNGAIGLQMLDLIAAEDSERVGIALARSCRLERVADFALSLALPHGNTARALATFAPADPVESGVFLVLRISGADGAPPGHDQLALGERALRLQAATLDSLPAHVALLDSAGRITAVNEAWRRFGRENGLDDPAGCIGESYPAVCRAGATLSPEAAAVLAGLEEVLSGARGAFELEYPCHGPLRRWFRVHINSVRSPFRAGAVVMHIEVTDRHLADEKAQLAARALRQLSQTVLSAEKEYKHRLDQAARYDALTGLANRAALESYVDEAIASAAGCSSACALMLINIDGFRFLNELLGHAGADALLLETAGRLQAAAPAGDLVARLGADEFAVMLVGLPDKAMAQTLAARVCERLSAPYVSERGALSVTAGIGFSCFPEDGESFDTLLRAATVALGEAKKSGANSLRAYERHMGRGDAAAWSLRSDFTAAIRAGEFAVFYQPTIELSGGRTRSIEALVRWRHPERGLLTPDKFIPLAEESGAIVELGEWVLQRACEDTVRLSAAVGRPLRVAVNLSARQFEGADLATKVARTLATSGLEPASLRLEITETTVMADPAASRSILRNLASMGISLALDDFGTGYSSLGYLQKFPLTCLKIDRSFVAGLPGNEQAAAIARTLVLLGKSLRMSIVAEGVETETQLNFLRASGCDEVQGYLFSKPLPYEEVSAWIRARDSA